MSFGIDKKNQRFLFFTGGSDVIAAGATSFIAIGGSITDSTTEAQRQLHIPFACVMNELTVITANGQPASGSMVFTVRKNGANTSIVLTIAANASAGTYTSTSSLTATFAANDLLSVQVVNNASGNSGAIKSWSIKTT